MKTLYLQEINEALSLIESLKAQLELQKEEVKTLKIKHSSKTQVFAQQSEVSHFCRIYKLVQTVIVL